MVRNGKYNARKTDGFDSRREAGVAAKLQAAEKAGGIKDLKFQVPFTLVEGKGKIRPIRYIADFTFWEGGRFVVADAKGFRTREYKLKKKLMALLLGYEVEEM